MMKLSLCGYFHICDLSVTITKKKAIITNPHPSSSPPHKRNSLQDLSKRSLHEEKREIFDDLEEIKQVTSLSPCKMPFSRKQRGEKSHIKLIYIWNFDAPQAYVQYIYGAFKEK